MGKEERGKGRGRRGGMERRQQERGRKGREGVGRGGEGSFARQLLGCRLCGPAYVPLKSAPSRGRIWTLGSTGICPLFVKLTRAPNTHTHTHKHTDHATFDIDSNWPHLRCVRAMRPKNYSQFGCRYWLFLVTARGRNLHRYKWCDVHGDWFLELSFLLDAIHEVATANELHHEIEPILQVTPKKT